MKRIIITASLLGGMLYQATAQEFTIGINAAQAGTSYKLPNGKVQLKPSFGGEVGLQIPLSNHLKILTGLDFFQYQSKATLTDNQVYSHNQIDDMGSSFEYRVVTTGYNEVQTASALRIPLMLQLTTGSLEKTQWYFNAGGKFMLPGKISVKSTASKLTTTGYYPDVNAEVHSLPQHGFGDVSNWQSNGAYSTKSGWFLSAGTGFSFKLSPSGKTRLYAGVYADYGLSNLKAGRESLSLITYNSQNVANVQANGTMGMNEVADLKLMNFGVQLKLGFGNKQKGKKAAINPKTETLPAALIKPAVKQEVKADAKPEAINVVKQEQGSDATFKKMTADEEQMLKKPIFFGQKNSIDLDAAAKKHLDAVSVILKKYPESRIVIKGHTCDIGTAAVNEKRSLERATACADYLISQGVEKLRLQTKAMGTAEPVATNTSEENREKNRRVTLGLIK